MSQDMNTPQPPEQTSVHTKVPAWIGMVQGGVIALCFVLGAVQIDPAELPGNVEGTGWGWGGAALAGYFVGSLNGGMNKRQIALRLFAAGGSLALLVLGILDAAV